MQTDSFSFQRLVAGSALAKTWRLAQRDLSIASAAKQLHQPLSTVYGFYGFVSVRV